jgi:ABC-type transport system substrate-binding protein
MIVRTLLSLALAFSLTGLAVTGDEEEEVKPKPPLKKVPLPDEGKGPGEVKPPPRPSGQLPGFDPGMPAQKAPPTPPGSGTVVPPGGTPPAKDPAGEPESAAGAYFVKLPDLAREAAIAKSPALKEFYERFTVAADRVTLGLSKPVRVTPLPLLWGKDKFPPEFGIVPVSDDDAVQEARNVAVKKVGGIETFEALAVEEVTKLLALKAVAGGEAPPPLRERLEASEKVLVAVLLFHLSAREENRRRGKSWDAVKAAVSEKLGDVRLGRVRAAGTDRNWAALKDLTRKYAELYTAAPKYLEPVLAARLLEAADLVKSDALADLVRSRELLTEYEARFPGSTNGVAAVVRKGLNDKSKKMIDDAQRVFANNKTEARNILSSVEKIDPANGNLRSMQQEMKLGYPVLAVGTRRMPEFMSPSLARFDSEHQVVELLFDGILDAVPEEATGARYLPNLTTDRGSVGAGLREYRLIGNVEWSGAKPDAPGSLFTAADVAGTLRLMRQKPWVPGSEAATWFDDPGFDPADPGRLRVRFKLGHLDPRSLLTMKILPAGRLLEMNKPLDDPDFARQPFGSGPYRLVPIHRTATEAPKEVILLANPAYARRPGHLGQPFIREIRLVDATLSTDLPADFRADRLHVLTDVPSKDLVKFSADNNLGGRVKTVTVADPHRVHILAINHRRPGLQSTDVRKGILHAIDRERVLADVFRPATMPEVHKPLTGPYPPASWAVPKPLGGTPPLYNRDLATARFRAYLATPTATPTLSLVYPNDDEQAKAACERMKLMIESPTSADQRKITVLLEPLPPRALLQRVEEEARFDLAYLPFDYRDPWYPIALGNALDPAAVGKHGRNLYGYLAPGTTPSPEDNRLSQTLAECRLHRDFGGKLTELTHRSHQQFLDAVPFVPLWQLDRHIVLSTAVKLAYEGQVEDGNPRLLDPTRLFPSIGRWRVE